MDGTEATTTRRGTCKRCGSDIPCGRRGPAPLLCGPCRKEVGTRCGTCKGCGCSVAAVARGRLPQYCKECKRSRPRKVYKYTRTCADCLCEFNGSRTRKYCDDCHRKRFLSGATFACVVCGDVRKRAAQGGNSSGLCCGKKCAGVLRTIRAKEKARHRGDGLRSLLDYVRKLVDKERSEAAKQYVRACLAIANWMHEWDSAPRSRRLRNRNKPRGCRKHGARAKRKGLPRKWGKALSIDAIGCRDGWICGICREPIVDIHSRSGSESASVDHIVPLNHPLNFKHGHTESNVQIAHRRCNEAKGCSVECESLLWCDNPRAHLGRIAAGEASGGSVSFGK